MSFKNIFWIYFCQSFPPFFLLFSCDLMTIFLYLDAFFIYIHTHTHNIFFVYRYREFFICLYLYKIVLNFWSLHFKYILNILHLCSPPLTITVFDIVYLWLFCVSLNWLLWVEMILVLFYFNVSPSFLSRWYVCLYQALSLSLLLLGLL